MKRAALLAAALALGGCFGGGSGPAPVEHFYRLPPPAPAAPRARPLLAGVLVVETPRAAGLLRGRPLVYADAARPLELRQYRYHLWSEPPALLLGRHLRAALAARGIAPEVRPAGPGALRVSGRLLALHRLQGASPPRAVLELELWAGRGGRELLRRRYRETAAARGTGIHATVAAMGRAADAVWARFIGDLEQALTGEENRGR